MEGNARVIYCPKCGRKVAQYDGKSKINVKAKCSKCDKLVVFDVDTGEVRQERLPDRTTGSGLRMY